MHFCVVGAGPAGFYTAEALLRRFGACARHVDLLDALPTPFGLVRYGVAPDHPEVKNVEHQWARLLTTYQHALRFWGNVALDRDVSVAELRRLYTGVVLCTGSQGGDRKLGVEGEREYTCGARDFVAWYNGYPARGSGGSAPPPPPIRLNDGDAAVIGQGNVALDVARMLLRTPDALRRTDCPEHVIAALAQCSIERARVIGRRGPAQASWTAKELRELATMHPAGVALHDAQLCEQDMAELRASRSRRRCVDILHKYGDDKDDGDEERRRRVHIHFKLTPQRIASDAVHCARNELVDGRARVIEPLQPVAVPAANVLRSIGYQTRAVAGVPFDERANCVPNERGRVSWSDDGRAAEEHARGVYVAGWLKRGPSGIIGTNKWDAEETVECLAADVARVGAGDDDDGGGGVGGGGGAGLGALLRERNVPVVDWHGWQRIDAEELRRGVDGVRRKIIDIDEMLRIGAVDAGQLAAADAP